jgi:hypothetical protein
VITFEDLHWDSLRLVKKHLYRRLATPLNNALGRLAIARHVTDPAEAREQYRRVEYNVEIALNRFGRHRERGSLHIGDDRGEANQKQDDIAHGEST